MLYFVFMALTSGIAVHLATPSSTSSLTLVHQAYSFGIYSQDMLAFLARVHILFTLTQIGGNLIDVTGPTVI